MKTKLRYLILIVCGISYAQIPTTDLVARYNFNNGSLTDAINNVSLTKTGTAATTIADRFGNANNAISLNGDDLIRPDIEFDVNNNTNPYLPKTVSFWLKTATNDANARIIYHDNDQSTLTDSDYLGLKIYLENGQIKAVNRVGSNGNVFTHPTGISDNEWHHVVVQAYSDFTFPNTRFYTYIYVDNVKIGGSGYNFSVSGINIADDNKHVGDITFSRLRGASVGSNNKYEDAIDDVLIYTRLLTDIEVYQAGGFAGTVYVNLAATGANNGMSWVNAFTNFQDALNSSLPINEIWVAKGTYKPDASDRDVSFIINHNVFGGFDGTEVNLLDRNMSLIHTTNATILSGDLLNNDDTTVDFSDTTRTDNSKHVVEVATNNLEINGLTIKDGYADAISGDDRFGAGLFKYVSIPNITVKNCVIKNNVALSGAGLSLSSNTNSTIVIDACIIDGNLANAGSGLDYHMSATNQIMNISITNSLFTNNKTDDDASKGRKGSGAVAARLRAYFTSVTLNATIVNNTFANNSSLGDSGSSVAGNFPVIGFTKRDGDWGNVTIANNIFWANVTHSNQVAKAIGKSHSLNIALQATDGQRLVENNTDEDNLSTFTITPTNTSSANPNLDVDFFLATGSPAIDTGSNNHVFGTEDLLGNPRIFNTTVDRGAYEFGSISLGLNSFQPNETKIKLYPNPTTSVINIKMKTDLKQATIFTVLGAKVLHTTSATINTNQLKSGVYLIKIENESGNVVTKRFIKQ